MRHSQQYGHMLLTCSDYDLYKDCRFDKCKFCLSKDICNWIYEEMGRVDAIYPVDNIPDISEEIVSINHQSEFSSKVLRTNAEHLNSMRHSMAGKRNIYLRLKVSPCASTWALRSKSASGRVHHATGRHAPFGRKKCTMVRGHGAFSSGIFSLGI